MTNKEVYKAASKTKKQELNTLVSSLSGKETKEFNSLVKLGDSEALAVWTVILERKEDNSEFYRNAFEN